MTHAGYARNFEWTLRLLAERGHEVCVALDREEKRNLAEHDKLLRSLAREYAEIQVCATPGRPKSDWNAVGAAFRTWLDYQRFIEPEFEDAPQLRSRAGRRLPAELKRFSELRIARAPWMKAAVRELVRLGHDGVQVRESVRRFFADQGPDVVIVTPLLEINSPQNEYVRCANSLGVPSIFPVSSWDNLTVKGLVHDLPQLVTVWNERQTADLRELHGVPSENVAVTGAVAYDHWFDWQPTASRSDFCRSVDLDPERPFVLYAGSSPFVARNEVDFVVRWITGLRAAAHPDLAGLQVLVRPHPQNGFADGSPGASALARLGDVAVYPQSGENPVDERTRSDYFHSIHYSTAVMGVNTSAFLESAILSRPVHTLLEPKYSASQRGALHFQHLESGGFLKVAGSSEENAEQIARSVRDGGDAQADNLPFVRSFIRPFGVEEPAAPRLVGLVEALGTAQHSYTRSPTMLRRVLGRPLARSGLWYVRRHVRSESGKPTRADEHAGRPEGANI